ncbi:NDE2, mitochondrial external NADH dehydrogenase [Suillus subalutaceus]|uniref:NDE2, mitochondrial external NADH dehydrogenase n=1 Tax=Suillus subalutaceus TaxID=48586 RepID=UPI001B85B931|nr:NDE2, mitochondrial external NADH dehydrogenase [Suillus subalutaceus]KAG1840375.1 NDE2, mitochondrial external NADH dehydrogenase [Suillus subalutaceus]
MQAARHVRFMSTSRSLVCSHVHAQKHFLRASTSRAQSRSVASTAAAASQTPPPPPPPSQGRWRYFLQTLGRVTLVTFDPSKKTLVILGSGWGATSLLKGLDTSDYNTACHTFNSAIVVSPKNFFLFTPLLPSVAVGTLNARSILQPTRYLTRHKERQVLVIEAEAKEVDPVKKTVTLSDDSEIQGQISSTTIPYDYLVYAVGAETQTFGIPGVREHACFMKELHDAEKMQRRFLDCVESAAFPGQSDEEKDRLLHMVVVGGGPTGIELSGELRDFLEEDLKSWYPELASRIRITLVEALPNVLPSFSKELIAYTERTFKESDIEILTKTMVRKVNEKSVVLKGPDGVEREVPCGMVVWAAGNTSRQITRDLMAKLPEGQTNKRGITLDDHLRMKGARDIFAIGDCTASSYAPTAQVASQQGSYLSRVFKLLAKKDKLEADLSHAEISEEAEKLKKQIDKIKLKPFHYSHQGSLAYIGSDKAIADLPIFGREWTSGGVATFMFWRSAYLSTLFSLRNRSLVAGDWVRVKLWGRDVSRE